MMDYDKPGDCCSLLYSFPAFKDHYHINPTPQTNYLFILQVDPKRPEENLISIKKGDDEAMGVVVFFFFNRANLGLGAFELRH